MSHTAWDWLVIAIHAIIDALLGAAALGDIGNHFSPDDSQYENISSLFLLARVRELLADHGWRVGNVDATIVAERPRLAPYIQQMRQAVGASLHVGTELISIKATTIDRVNVKATTTDGMGFAGREEGIAAQAIALIDPVQ